MGSLQPLLRRHRKPLKKCLQCMKHGCVWCIWLNIVFLLYLFLVFIQLQLNVPKKTSRTYDIERFLEHYRNNVSFKEREFLLKWRNKTNSIQPYDRTRKCGVMETRARGNASHKTRLVSDMRCNEKYDVVILTASDVYDFDQRMLIRTTWGRDRGNGESRGKGGRWMTYFIVGLTDHTSDTMKMLSCEIELYNDIVYGNVYEHFDNLTPKVQMGFEWVLTYCNFTYLLKTDADVFVNIPTLLNYLRQNDTRKTKLYSGAVQFAGRVLRGGKFAISRGQYRKRVYPRYCSGGGFLLSVDVVTKMTSHFADVKQLRINDAYIGELALKSGVDVIDDERFSMSEDPDACEYKEHLIVHHPITTKKCMLYLFVKQVTAKSKK